jgi:hypothetical protein
MGWYDIWDESASVPFWGTPDRAEKLSGLVRRCVATVTGSASPREMVLESWLVVDYAIRDLLVSGYGLTGFCEEDFDVRYELLPKSFKGLLEFLEGTICHQKGLGPEPSMSDDYPPYVRFSSIGFLRYLAYRHPDVRDRLKEIEGEYFADVRPELASEIEQGGQFLLVEREKKTNRVPSGWTEVAGDLGEDWFKDVRRLNRARNKAAHSYDPAAIARAFGVQGPEAVDRVRNECLKLLKRLLGTALAADDPDDSVEAT